MEVLSRGAVSGGGPLFLVPRAESSVGGGPRGCAAKNYNGLCSLALLSRLAGLAITSTRPPSCCEPRPGFARPGAARHGGPRDLPPADGTAGVGPGVGCVRVTVPPSESFHVGVYHGCNVRCPLHGFCWCLPSPSFRLLVGFPCERSWHGVPTAGLSGWPCQEGSVWFTKGAAGGRIAVPRVRVTASLR